MNEFLATVPFDLYELSLFQLVVEHGSFTRAGQAARLTQSAITRQISGVEQKLGVTLFERTTRSVRLTAAGQLLYDESKPILDTAGALLKRLQQGFHLVPPTLRIGVARSIGLAYYPGFFFAFRKRKPDVQLHVEQLPSAEILDAVESGTLDAGLLSTPRRLPRALVATHRFSDEFLVIAPIATRVPGERAVVSVRAAKKLFAQERWLLIDRQGETGRTLHKWLGQQSWSIEPAMELDSFDVIVNLVALGLGLSLVPHRVLALYGERRPVRRISIRPRFARELAVVVRKNRVLPEPLASFVKDILF
ncbi:MAG TPA: LysR family transcriptional regulator [Verrucomicrobiota bacterium]|nr:LysR family transcriptional regulator [Verrucomicrobiota bacterium]